MTDNAYAIEMTGVHKWFGDFHVLRDINLQVKPGDRVVICGPSGSGKSTVVRCLNGLETHEQGLIKVDGNQLTKKRMSIARIRERWEWFFSSLIYSHI